MTLTSSASGQLLSAQLDLSAYAKNHSSDELLRKFLDTAEDLTGSKVGFFHFVEEDQETLSLQMWSSRTLSHFCKANGRGLHYNIKEAGVWVDCAHQKKAVIHNDYLSLPHRKGFPANHVLIQRELVVPVFRNELLVAILGVGNKPTNYTNEDLEKMEILASLAWDLVQTKILEEKLKISVDQFSRVTEESPDAIFIVDKKGNYTFANKAASELLGYTIEELCKMNIRDLGEEGISGERFTSLVGKGKLFTEMKIRRKDGGWVPVDLNAVVLPTGDMYGSCRDLSKRLRAEKLVQQGEEKFRQVIAQMKQGLAVHEAVYDEQGKMVDYKFLEMNDSFCTLSGIDRSEAIGKTVMELLPSTEKYWVENYEKVVKTGEPLFFESFAREIGRYFAVTAYRNQENQFATLIQDVTDKMMSEQELLLQNKIAQAFVTSSNNEFFKTVLDVFLKNFNSRYGFFGYINKEGNMVCPSMTYDIWEETLIPEKSSVFPKNTWGGLWGESIKRKQTLIKNEGLVVPMGHVKLDNSMSAVILRSQEVIGILMLGNKEEGYSAADSQRLDRLCGYISPLLFSMLKELDYKQELIEAKQKAEENDQLKSAFLANMSHEIRTPLNSILGFVDLIDDQEIEPENQSRYFDIIRLSSKRLMKTINDIIDISRIEAGQVLVGESEFRIRENLLELETSFRSEAEQKGLEFELDLSQIQEQDIFVTDTEKVNAILVNLVKNAIKYTLKGRILVACEATEKMILFFVKDTGIGIPADKVEIIFDRFAQADNLMTRSYEGSGLGLSICKAYAEMINAKLWFESEVGTGSTFYLAIPQN